MAFSFNSLKIGTKLSVTFGIVLAAFAGFGWFAIEATRSISSSANEIAVDWMPSIQKLAAVKEQTEELRISSLRAMLQTDQAKIEEFADKIPDKKEKVRSAIAAYLPTISSPEERALSDSIQKYIAEYEDVNDQAIKMLRNNQRAEALAFYMSKTEEPLAKFTDGIAKDIELNDKGAKNEVEHGKQIYKQTQQATYIVTGGVAILVLSSLFALIFTIAKPIRVMADTAGKLAEGDYSTAIEGLSRRDEVGAMAKSLSEIRDAIAIYSGQIKALNNSQAVITFKLDGTIMDANPIFLNVMGYTLEEVKGKHHSMFVEPAYKSSPEYKQFWEGLNRGEAQGGEILRIGKGGKEVWLQATYSAIRDSNDKVISVGKYAMNITEATLMRQENEKGVQEAVTVLTDLSQGDLTHKMTGQYAGAFADIKKAVNGTIEKLIETMIRIKDTAASVNSAASEISSGSSDLSMRTEQQASSLEETAASMEEITGTVKQNSKNANSANELSTNASTVADAGGKVVAEAVIAMGSIEKSSQKISDIIGVIDEIAFQTNLLALNAAVEAARAGDAGKGFAVVASEVRALAGRSASASKEIKTLINESASQVKTGAQLVNQAGETLKGIVGSVRQVAGIISEIASASTEQSTGIDEINAAVTQMDEATQQNAALVEENTAAAQSLLEQAKMLEGLVSFFKVGEQESASPAAIRMKPNADSEPLSRPAAKIIRKPLPHKRSTPPLLIAKMATNGKASNDGWEEF